MCSLLLGGASCASRNPHNSATTTQPAPLSTKAGSIYEYIEGYQRARYGGVPPDATKELPAVAFRRANDSFIFGLCPEVIRASLLHSSDPLPTRYTNYDVFVKTQFLLPYVVCAIDRSRPAIGRRLQNGHLTHIPISTLPLATINAISLSAPVADPGYFIAFSEGASLWFHRLARASVAVASFAHQSEGGYLIDDTSRETYEKRLEANPTIKASVVHSLLQIAAGDPLFLGADELSGTADSDHIACELAMAMQLFVLSHEASHVLLGHRRDVSSQSGSQIARTWADEVEADYLGTILFLFALEEMGHRNALFSEASRSTWISAPQIFISYTTASESARAVALRRADPNRLSAEQAERSRQYCDNIVSALTANKPRPSLPPPIDTEYPPRAARSRVLASATKWYLQSQGRHAHFSEHDKRMMRLGLNLAIRVNELLQESAPDVDGGLFLVQLRLLFERQIQ
jgi:hypothetical protein